MVEAVVCSCAVRPKIKLMQLENPSRRMFTELTSPQRGSKVMISKEVNTKNESRWM